MAIARHHKEILEIVETEVTPAVSEIGRRSEGEYELEVLVVLIVGLVGLGQEAEPNPPFVEKQLFLKHVL